MRTFLPSSTVRAISPALLLCIPLSATATDPEGSGAEAVAAYHRLISAQTESLKIAMLSQLGADKYWEEVVEGLTLTEQQRAELRALQLLADDRFNPHLEGADLTESIQAVLTGAPEPQQLAAGLEAEKIASRP